MDTWAPKDLMTHPSHKTVQWKKQNFSLGGLALETPSFSHHESIIQTFPIFLAENSTLATKPLCYSNIGPFFVLFYDQHFPQMFFYRISGTIEHLLIHSTT